MYLLKLRFNNATKQLLAEVAELRDASSIEALFEQLAEAELASLRLTKVLNRRVAESKPIHKFPKHPVSKQQENCRESARIAQKILFFHEEGEINPPAIAQRLGISAMTVHRVIQTFENSKTRVQVSVGRGRAGRHKGASMDLLLPPKTERSA
jgi:hypothetical protein